MTFKYRNASTELNLIERNKESTHSVRMSIGKLQSKVTLQYQKQYISKINKE